MTIKKFRTKAANDWTLLGKNNKAQLKELEKVCYETVVSPYAVFITGPNQDPNNMYEIKDIKYKFGKKSLPPMGK